MDGPCRCWASERILFDGLSERGWEVEGAAGSWGGMVMRVAGEMKMDCCHTQDNVSTMSTRREAKDVVEERREEGKEKKQ
jgi:hypothetical protein